MQNTRKTKKYHNKCSNVRIINIIIKMLDDKKNVIVCEDMQFIDSKEGLKTCPNCGSQIQEGYVFCDSCGTKL